jgi:hypothetical protein
MAFNEDQRDGHDETTAETLRRKMKELTAEHDRRRAELREAVDDLRQTHELLVHAAVVVQAGENLDGEGGYCGLAADALVQLPGRLMNRLERELRDLFEAAQYPET